MTDTAIPLYFLESAEKNAARQIHGSVDELSLAESVAIQRCSLGRFPEEDLAQIVLEQK